MFLFGGLKTKLQELRKSTPTKMASKTQILSKNQSTLETRNFKGQTNSIKFSPEGKPLSTVISFVSRYELFGLIVEE